MGVDGLLRQEPGRGHNVFYYRADQNLDAEEVLEVHPVDFGAVMEMIAAVYQEGVEKGIFIPGHKNAHADILWAVFTGLILWEDAKKQLNPKKDFLKPTLDRAFDIFLRGIKVI